MSKIINLHKKIIDGLLDINTLKKDTLDKLKECKSLNAYINFIDDISLVKSNPNSLLNGIPYAVKDNIHVLNSITTGGSLFFENYKSPFNATVIDLLNESGAIPVVKANLDEFGLGGTGTFSAYGYVKNPYDESRITSGSSSGSAVLVANGTVPFALGTDTGDSIRKPASYLGIIGYKPTYGLVSRNGVFPYSPSLDHVGLLATSVTDVAIVSDVICKHDINDFTSQQQEQQNFYKNINNTKEKYKIFYFKNILQFVEPNCRKLFLDSIDKIKQLPNIEIFECDYPIELISLIATVYRIISYSEAVSCYQNINGILFGHTIEGENFNDSVSKIRSKYFGYELKRRFVFGSYCTLNENYNDIYKPAKKIRRIIVDKLVNFFNEYDFVIMPGSSNYAPTIEELESGKYQDTYADDYLQIANFGGLPSITIPMGKVNNNHIGINICGNINNDKELLIFTKLINSLLNQGD